MIKHMDVQDAKNLNVAVEIVVDTNQLCSLSNFNCKDEQLFAIIFKKKCCLIYQVFSCCSLSQVYKVI